MTVTVVTTRRGATTPTETRMAKMAAAAAATAMTPTTTNTAARWSRGSSRPTSTTTVFRATLLALVFSLSTLASAASAGTPPIAASPRGQYPTAVAAPAVPASTAPAASSGDFTGISNMGTQKLIGLTLAIGSSLAIGTSFIITKRGLMDAADRGGVSNASDSHSYLGNPIWLAGMFTMVIGEVANFAAYTFAPPILVTPLGALSVLIGAVLASFILKEELGRLGRVGCTLCLVGTVIIVVNAPEDKEIQTVDEILNYALQTPFLTYCLFVLGFAVWMIWRMVPRYGKRTPLVYLSICSLVGSISVMSVKGFGVALKLTFDGNNQFTHPSTYCFAIVVVVCILVQMNYFNKALDQFSTNIVNPIYYVMFTTSTIFASFLLFRGFNTNGAAPAVSLLGGFVVIFLGVYLLNMNRLIDPVTQQPRMSLVTGQGVSNTGRLSESYEHLMGNNSGGLYTHGSESGFLPHPHQQHSRRFSQQEYWAAAAGPGANHARNQSHSRRDSGGSVLFNAYDMEDAAPGGGLAQVGEEGGSEDDDSGAMNMTPVSAAGGRRNPYHQQQHRNNGASPSPSHRRSASLKTVVGANGKVVSGGAGNGVGNELGAVRKSGGSGNGGNGGNGGGNGGGSHGPSGVIR